jgi:multidrug efflux system membrane fusion protein
VKKAETAYMQAVEQANASKTAIGTTDSAAATVEARRSELALAERDLRNTVVRAPHDGRVTGLNIRSGEYVALGQSIFTLVVTEEWFASANFRETELKHIAVGSCAVAYSLIDRRVAIRGKVDGIGFGVTDQDRVNVPRGVPYVAKSVNWVRVEQRFPVRIRLEHPAENLMRLGASAVVQIRPGDKC